MRDEECYHERVRRFVDFSRGLVFAITFALAIGGAWNRDAFMVGWALVLYMLLMRKMQ
jgi:hypothetical protein